MSKFNIEKQTEKARFVVEKRGVKGIPAQVITALDVSGSAQGLFKSGQMQRAWELILPIAAVFDLNSEIDVYTFADGDHMVTHIDPPATVKNYENYIKKNILNNRVPLWGGTDYAPVIERALKDFGFYKTKSLVEKTKGFLGFGAKTVTSSETILLEKSDKNEPVICYLFTDGSNSDKRKIENLFAEMEKAKTQFYVLFIGVGGADFPFIEELGDRFGNIGFVSAKNLDKFADSDDIYDQLIPEEMTQWLSSAVKN